jgi:hypothetical protein
MEPTPPTDVAPRVPGYDLLERVGAGGSSAVWRARRSTDDAAVAVKVVTAWGEEDRAVREFALLRRLPVEGLVRVHEAFSLPDDPRAVAVVLDLVEGGSLTEVLLARGHLTPGETVTVVAPVARALAELHTAGVVHADVSPGNVLLERTGRPRLADLGVARLVGEAHGDLFGTPGFVAPEVEAGEQPTPASDVYAVGALAWACVTGEPPAPLGLRRPLLELAPGLPPAWLDVVVQCLSPLADERPSAGEVALRLFDAVACEPLRLVALGDEVSLITHRLRAAGPVEEEPPAPTTRRWRPLRPLRPLRPAGLGPPWRLLRRWAGGTRVRRVLSPAVLCLVLALLVPVVLWATGGSGRAQAVAGARAPVSHPATSEPADPRGSARTAHLDAPREDPVRLVQALADARADVLTAADPRLLGRVDHPGSPAWTADELLLRRLTERGERYEGLELTVRSAELTRAEGERAVVRTRVDTGAYVVTGPSGARTARPAEAGERLLMHLRWSANGWRVEQVAPGPA